MQEGPTKNNNKEETTPPPIDYDITPNFAISTSRARKMRIIDIYREIVRRTTLQGRVWSREIYQFAVRKYGLSLDTIDCYLRELNIMGVIERRNTGEIVLVQRIPEWEKQIDDKYLDYRQLLEFIVNRSMANDGKMRYNEILYFTLPTRVPSREEVQKVLRQLLHLKLIELRGEYIVPTRDAYRLVLQSDSGSR